MLLKPVDEEVFDMFITTIVTFVDALMEAKANTKNISVVIIKEAHQFQKTITHGQKLLDELIAWASKKAISGKDIFKLYDTFGFPLELTKEIVEEHGLSLDLQWFEQEMQAQQQRSRAWSKDMFKQWVDRANYLQWISPTTFIGYETLETDTMKLLKDFDVAGQRILVFDSTPFYAESGGQIWDRGVVILDDGSKANVVQVQKYNWIFLHFVE
jgi:alanyl-tRNA synthetase